MREEFFAKEVNEVLGDIDDYCAGIYDNILYLHHMTGWSYGEIVDKVSRNQDYYGTADAIRFFVDAEIRQEQKNSSWNEIGRGVDISF